MKKIPTDSATVAAVDKSPQNNEVHRIGSIHWKLENLILPELKFDDATLNEGVVFLREKSIELDTSEQDPDRRGINFVVLKSQLRRPDSGLEEKTLALRDEVGQLELRMNQIALDNDLLDADVGVDDDVYRAAKLRLEEQKIDIGKRRNLIRTRMDMDGNDLIPLLASDGGSAEIARLYPKYSDMKRDLAAIGRDSALPEESKSARIEAAREELKELQTELGGAVDHYRRSLGTELKVEELNLSNAMASLKSLAEDMRNWKARSSDYRAAKREYELKLGTLGMLEQAAAERSVKLDDAPGLATLDLKSVPLEVALTYFTQQIGASFAVQPYAVVIGSPAEIAALEK